MTRFQVQVARLFFSLPAADGFLLAGGAALLAHRLTTRPTKDLDFFTSVGAADVSTARNAFEDAADRQGWIVERIQDRTSFCRLLVHGPEDLVVDLALDAPPEQPPSAGFVGPTFALEELAGRKLIALFDRAEARDFCDVYALAQRFNKEVLLSQASAIDAGFDSRYLAQMFRTLDRFEDVELPVPPEDARPLRAFFAAWITELAR